MGLANSILAQRQFNEIVSRFNHPANIATTVNPNTCSTECLQMLMKEGFIVCEGKLGTHTVSLPTEHNKGFWFNR